MGLIALGLAASAGFASAPLSGTETGASLDAARLSGLTRDALGQILADVEILFAPVEGERAGEPFVRVRSDASGRFRVPDLTPGLYRVVAAKGGYGVVVGQVNTLMQASLDLILFPTGREEADPSDTPADASWALRLPKRDVLEDGDFGFTEPLAGGANRKAQAPARPPLHLALTHQRFEDGSAPAGAGLVLDLDGALPLGELGNVRLDVDYARVGRSGEARDDASLVSLGWIAPGGIGVASRVDALGSRRERASAGRGADRVFASLERYAISAGQMRARPGGSLVLDLRAENLDAEQALGEETIPLAVRQARQVRGSADLRREWSERHASRVRIDASHGANSLVSLAEGETLLVPATDNWSFAALDRIDGSSLSLLAEDRHDFSPALSGVLRASAHSLPGSDRDLRSASTLGVVWQPLEGTRLRAELGAAWGGVRDAAELWRVEFEHADENWNVRVAHGVQTGAAPWAEERDLDPSPLLVTDHDGLMEIWSIETSLSPNGSWWPTLALRGELFTIDGRVAARLGDDVPFVPVVADGRAEGRRLELGVTLARLGTLIEVSWEGVEDDDSSRELLGGARAYTRRGVNVRQRLGMIEWYGTNCYLLVGLVEQDVRDPRSSETSESGRLAFLDQRRFSGGLAVAF